MGVKIISVLTLFFCVSLLHAQDIGKFSGSFESNTHVYENDKDIGARKPNDKIASNNYLNLKYQYKYFDVGVRLESYLPSLQGFNINYKGTGIANRYIRFKNDNLDVTAGNFYEQFGSGLIFRTFEERQLGIDNSLDGIRLKYDFKDIFFLKAIMGTQRNAFKKNEDDLHGKIRGLDVDLSINNLLEITSFPLMKLGVSYISKYEKYNGSEDVPVTVDAFSARFDIESESADMSLEYVEKDKDFNQLMFLPMPKGRALLLNGGLYGKGLSLNYTIRRLENMSYQSLRTAIAPQMMINYLPVLVKQHSYSLSNIYIYHGNPNGEIGLQCDLLYKIPKKSFLGGKYGTQLAFNYAQYNDLKRISATETKFFEISDDLFYRDFSLEITKKWSKKFKSILVYNYQELKKSKDKTINPNIISLDMQYKITSRNSMRLELQHLSIDDDKKNWMASLLEFSFAPSYSFFVADDYNYGNENKVHYYTCGISLSKASTKFIATYGRQREGLSCVGGVCRIMPAMKAFTISLSTRF